MTKTILLVLASILAGSATAADDPGDALAIMNKVAANTTEATEARRQYVYKQRVRAGLVRTTGPIRRPTDATLRGRRRGCYRWSIGTYRVSVAPV